MIRGSRLLKRFQMATDAVGGQALPIELSDCSHFVARVAIHHGVSPDQRKAVLMLVDIVNGDLPAIHPVTQVALSTVLAAMKVGVAVLTLLSDIAEHGIDVALLAGHFGVHAA